LAAAVLTAAVSAPIAAADLPALIAAAARWESGQNPEPLRRLEQLVQAAAGQEALRAELETALVGLLAPSATFEARRFACQQLAVVGSEASVSAIAKLLADQDTVGLACLAFGNRPSRRADQALRAALATAQGPGRLQIISTLGNRRDPKAVPALARLARDADPAVAATAVGALGKIANTAARNSLLALCREAPAPLQPSLAAALLSCADSLLQAGRRTCCKPAGARPPPPFTPTCSRPRNPRRCAAARLRDCSAATATAASSASGRCCAVPTNCSNPSASRPCAICRPNLLPQPLAPSCPTCHRRSRCG